MNIIVLLFIAVFRERIREWLPYSCRMGPGTYVFKNALRIIFVRTGL